MNRTAMIRAMQVAAVAMLAFVAPSALAQKSKASIPWVSSLAKAKKTAAKQNKPLMVDFSAEWCPPCKAMKASTWKDGQVIERAKRFVPVLIDIDKQRKATDDARVTAVPTIVFYTSKGKEILRAEGYRDVKGILDLMAEAEKKARS